MKWILLVIFAGFSNGSFALPMKFTTKWNWENTWGMFIFWGFVVLPVLLGLFTVPDLAAICKDVGTQKLLRIFGFGFLWGIGSICFGLGIKHVGIGLAFSINIGITIAIGSLMPLFLTELSSAETKSIVAVAAGVVTIVVGVVISGYAALLRERDQQRKDAYGSTGRPTAGVFRIGLLLCICAGVMSPMLQFAFIHGDAIIQAANARGVSETIASNAVWAVALAGGFLANSCYVIKLLIQHDSWRLYRMKESGRYHGLALLMGLFWVITIACYGMAVSNLGVLGLSVGWAIFNSVGIITANLLGLFTKEWRGVSRKTYTVFGMGLATLVLGTCLVAAL